ncbi:MAG: hypothetical protein J5910_09590 [Lachnospiraceae bacterium]|nr:hypothetical protein [Lachnospiraceae bacterium]
MEELHGTEVLTRLAKVYQQLYIAPGRDKTSEYDDVVKRGHEISEGSLSHFTTSEKDSLVYEDTPAGKVCVITLYHRQDFVTFLQIMAGRCELTDIPDTQGASIIDGVANWEKIRAHKDDFYKEENAKGNPCPDWPAEFRRFTSDKKNYLDTLIVLSVGPYSGVSADRMGLSEDEWLPLSHTIRKHHECTHFICRRKYPDLKDAIWDELVADAVGIYAAFDHFDPQMEKIFLGIEGDHYTKGRLENYVEASSDSEKLVKIEEMTGKIIRVLEQFEKITSDNPCPDPYDIAIMLEESAFSPFA